MPSSWATILGLSQAAEIDGILPKQEGAYADGLNASHWINTDWNQLWTRRRTRAKQEIEESFSHPPPHPSHWQQDLLDLDPKPEQQTMLATLRRTTHGWSSLRKPTPHQDGSIL